MSSDAPASRSTVVILAALLAGAVMALVLVLAQRGLGRDTPSEAGVTAATVLASQDRFVGTTVRVGDRVTDVVAVQSVTLGRGRLLVLDVATAPTVDDTADGDLASWAKAYR